MILPKSFHHQHFACVLSLIWLAVTVGDRAEAGRVLQTPAGLNPGDHFRFVFITDGVRDATSTNIVDYDSFVIAQAAGATYNGVVVDWLAIVSTDSVDAIDHVDQAAAPVYLSDGTLVTTTTTPAGLWSGTLVHEINLDLAAISVSPFNFVWTGTNPTGTGFGGPLGAPTPQVGSDTDTDGAWISSGRSPAGDLRNLYGISADLVVPSAVPVPEPSSLVLLGTALSVGFVIGRVRQNRLSYLSKIVPVVLAATFGPLAVTPARARADLLTGLTTTGNLLTFDSATPGAILSTVAINSLQSGEVLLGIDRRPADGLLYGLGSTSRLYTINSTTGAAIEVGSPGAFTLIGAAFGFDFNPVPDRIRVVTTDTTNLRLNPNTGTLASTDTPLAYATGDSGAGITPRVVGSAYTNNFNGAALTTLFGIDSNRNVLVMQGGPNGLPSPNGGVLTTIGAGLGFDTSDLVGFDVSGISGIAYASMTAPGGSASQLFTIDLDTGAASLVGTIGTGLTLTGLAANVGEPAVVPEPASLLLMSIGGLGLIAVAPRRRGRKT
jgi:hypothetical protein